MGQEEGLLETECSSLETLERVWAQAELAAVADWAEKMSQ